jgi:hypothetical protein
LSAVLKLPRLCIVISNLSGAYDNAAKKITSMIAKAIRDLQNETSRQAKGITPVELGSDEIYNILRTRLLTAELEKKVVDAISTAFSDSISDMVKSKTIAKSTTQIADEISTSCPFNPSFKRILPLFKENERFRQTRGLMTMSTLRSPAWVSSTTRKEIEQRSFSSALSPDGLDGADGANAGKDVRGETRPPSARRSDGKEIEANPTGQIVGKPWGPKQGLVLDDVVKFLKISNTDHRFANGKRMMIASPPQPRHLSVTESVALPPN